MAENKKLKKIQDGMYVGNVALIITDNRTTEPSNFRETDDKGKDLPSSGRDWIEWGDKDNYPDEIEDLNSQEPVSSRCLEFKTKALIGQGLFWYRKEFRDGKEFHHPVDLNSREMEEIKDFCEASDIDSVLMDLALDFEWWNVCYSELIKGEYSNKFVMMSRIDAAYCRLAPKDPKTGRYPKVFISSKFGQKKPAKKDIQEVNMVDPEDPFKDKKAMFRAARSSSRRLYYPKPSWHSTFGSLDLALESFKWIRSNLRNSKNIKYMVKVPWNYFLSRFRLEDFNGNREEWLEAIKADEVRLYQEMDDVLAGSENAMKSFKTKYGTDDEGNEIDEFKIEPLTVDTQHAAWLPLYDTTTAAICSGHGVSPVLASIIISSTMGANSGSTVREYFNFYTQFETTIPRQVVLSHLLFVKKHNGWPSDIFPGFRNIILETLDNNPSGSRTQGEGNPTTTNKES